MRSHKLGTKHCFIAAEALQAMLRVKINPPSKINAQGMGIAVACAIGFFGFYMQCMLFQGKLGPKQLLLLLKTCK